MSVGLQRMEGEKQNIFFLKEILLYMEFMKFKNDWFFY